MEKKERVFTNTGVISSGEMVAYQANAKRAKHARQLIQELHKRAFPDKTVVWHEQMPVEVDPETGEMSNYRLFGTLQRAATIVTDGHEVIDIKWPQQSSGKQVPHYFGLRQRSSPPVVRAFPALDETPRVLALSLPPPKVDTPAAAAAVAVNTVVTIKGGGKYKAILDTVLAEAIAEDEIYIYDALNYPTQKTKEVS